MSTVHIALDAELATLVRSAGEPLEQAAGELIGLERYHRHSISSGKAADLLGMGRAGFIAQASRLGIPFFDLTGEEWERELEAVEALRGTR